MKIKIAICSLALWLASSTLSGEDAPEPTATPVAPQDSATHDNAAISAEDCVKLSRAHAALLDGCFSARREFSAVLNNKPVKREVVRIDYSAGDLEITLIEEEIFENRIKTDGEGDMVIESVFSCDRMTRDTDGHYALKSAEEPERLIFRLDSENAVLLPLRWEFEEKTRFLFKKFHIMAHADYSNVNFQACDAVPDTREP